MSAWQPIETAPKDGTKIIGLREGQARQCYWGEYYPKQYVWFTGRTLPTMSAEPETFQPTHWIPFPSPPNTINADGVR